MSPKRWFVLLLFVLTPLLVSAKELLLESSRYNVYFAFIKVGEAETKLYKSKNGTYRAISRAYTTGIIDKIYTVRDYLESTFTDSHFIKYRARIREGHYRRDDLITYNPKTGTITYIKNGKLKRKGRVEGPVFDMLSSYFAYRKHLKAEFTVTSGKKEAKPKIKCLSKKKVYVCKLWVPVKGLLVSRNPKKPVTMYIDKRTRILLLSKIPTRWGTIRIKLKGAGHGKDGANHRRK